jgi:hypothetical protein
MYYLRLDKQEITKEPQNDVFEEIKNMDDFDQKESKPNDMKFCSSRPGTFRVTSSFLFPPYGIS